MQKPDSNDRSSEDLGFLLQIIKGFRVFSADHQRI
jgi:hypothetical protein